MRPRHMVPAVKRFESEGKEKGKKRRKKENMWGEREGRRKRGLRENTDNNWGAQPKKNSRKKKTRKRKWKF